MKQIKLILIAMVMLATSSYAQSKAAPWPEMKAFHSLMAATFHPSEEGDLKPLREKADSLYTAAKMWQGAAIPADFKAKETQEALQKLNKQIHAIQAEVKANGTDEKLKGMISEAHDTFHKIAGECRKKANEGHEGHGH